MDVEARHGADGRQALRLAAKAEGADVGEIVAGELRRRAARSTARPRSAGPTAPRPSSLTLTRVRPPPLIAISICDAPASMAFLASSLTTLAGPLDHLAWRAVHEVRRQLPDGHGYSSAGAFAQKRVRILPDFTAGWSNGLEGLLRRWGRQRMVSSMKCIISAPSARSSSVGNIDRAHGRPASAQRFGNGKLAARRHRIGRRCGQRGSPRRLGEIGRYAWAGPCQRSPRGRP